MTPLHAAAERPRSARGPPVEVGSPRVHRLLTALLSLAFLLLLLLLPSAARAEGAGAARAEGPDDSIRGAHRMHRVKHPRKKPAPAKDTSMPTEPPGPPRRETTYAEGEGCSSTPAEREAAAEGCALLIDAAATAAEEEGESDDSGGLSTSGGDEEEDAPAGEEDEEEEQEDEDPDWSDEEARREPPRRSGSPVSRLALLVGAIALPFRRRTRRA